jgi:hypothetical protein
MTPINVFEIMHIMHVTFSLLNIMPSLKTTQVKELCGLLRHTRTTSLWIKDEFVEGAIITEDNEGVAIALGMTLPTHGGWRKGDKQAPRIRHSGMCWTPF